MKLINVTGNSVYVEDIDTHFSYDESLPVIEVDSDTLKKSSSLQELIILGGFDIVEAGHSRIEQNVIRKQKERKSIMEARKTEEETEIESGQSPEVVVKGHFYEAGGYAKVNRNLAITLAKMGCKVEIQPTTLRRNDLNEMDIAKLSPLKRKVGKQAIRIDSIIPSFSEISARTPYRILYTTIESETIPDQTIKICNSYDEVWVTSDFCKDVLLKSGLSRPTYVIPSTVDPLLYNEKAEPHLFRPALKPFVFVSVFGWSYRKGYDALLRAYLKEFNGADPVSLLIVSRYQYSSTSGKHIENEISKFIKQYGGEKPAHIARCGRVIPENEMPKIYKACNAFVLPSRGEGFGMPYIEASLCGLPVIATNHSGQTMFLKDDGKTGNSYLVDVDFMTKVKPGQMHVHYWDNQSFPSLTSDGFIDDLGYTMRYVYENYKEALSRNKLLQSDILSRFTCEASVRLAKQRIDDIWLKIKGK